ncbi:sigma-70 family RNA polymerase sigma factor [Methylobacterium sp. NEAU 140]|uniref:RNA polymerase sigma factor n=1 Tax=Methylobacterium sp. NEAU 140 TaxID=3064945 RepID=UPI002733D722|nr:sigma-70 family RNA polymerase sigma factor [Methylobacterium sp. NEAU 140]MDP4026018.1 sigma-70 family RNA polymerase sigma factor [Methylobacterium sp. NEAU 140]
MLLAASQDMPPREAPRPPPEAERDADLARRAAAGERAAFEALLRRHYDRMHRVAWRMTGSRHDAEDIAQEVCCALVTRIAGYRGEATVATWLTGIVINACRDHHRRRATLGRLKDGLAVLVGLAPGPDGRDLHRRAWLAGALARLDAPLRETVVLVGGEGLTHAEAAAALGLAESTVSWRLHEARRILKTHEARDGA